MNSGGFINLIIRKKLAIIVIVVVFILLSAVLTFTQTFKYESGFKMLVIHNFGTNTDPYVASKSNEYLSGILAKVIYSNSFFEKVNKAGFKINKDYFGKGTEEKMKKWEKTVAAKNIGDSGMISVAVYHPDSYQAEQIARALAFSMQASHQLYHGYGENVTIKIIDEPLTSEKPVKPNIILNFSGAIVLGLILSLIYIYLFPAMDKKEGKENNWESVGNILRKREYVYSPVRDAEEDEGRSLEENKLEVIEDKNNFGQSNVGD